MSKAANMELKINEEYRNIVPPQTEEEYQQLKKSITENGQYAPISYNEEFEVLDGHHRFKICQELGLTLKIEAKPRQFPSKLHEKLFVIDMNLQRRQLTPYVRGRLALMTKPILEEIARQRMLSGKKPDPTQTFAEGEVNEEIGKRARLSRETVRKIETIEKFADEEDKEKLAQDKATINAIFNKIEKEQAQQKIIQKSSKKDDLPEGIKLLQGDFLEKSLEIANDSIDLIFTDPPYDRKNLHVYEGLGALAQRVLKDGGSLITYAGQYEIPTILDLVMKSGLKYWWMICVVHGGGHKQMFQRGVFVKWKPLLWLVKGKELMDGLNSVDDLIESKPPDKSTHEWAQSPVEAEYLISKLTIGENQVILDPFMGDGTTGIAALKNNRKFIGIELDKERFQVANGRLQNAVRDLQKGG